MLIAYGSNLFRGEFNAQKSRKFHSFVRALAVVLAFALFAFGGARAQYAQQGPKLVGTGAISQSAQGGAVSLSGNGELLVVGGPGDAGGTGAVWVFARAKGAWSQKAKLVGSDGGGAVQGLATAISKDGGTIIVGGPDDGGDKGALWIFVCVDNACQQQGSKLVPNDVVNGALGAAFGLSVAISADGNTAIVGGPGDNTNIGAAWVFTRSGGQWSQQGPKLVGSGGTLGSAQGNSVALSGDGNTAIIGAYFDNNGVGAAWIFKRSADVWTQVGKKLVGASGYNVSYLGTSVAMAGDGRTALVGGWLADTGVGAAYVYNFGAGHWRQGTVLVGNDAVTSQQGDQQYSHSVALSAHGQFAVIGGEGDNNGVGAFWVFQKVQGVWTQQGAKLVGSGAVGAATQGYSIAMSRDGSTIAEGARFDNGRIGASWVFTRPK